ncbi:MAG: hypothetical protein V3T64_05670, partial [Myxococcota bacterium]
MYPSIIGSAGPVFGTDRPEHEGPIAAMESTPSGQLEDLVPSDGPPSSKKVENPRQVRTADVSIQPDREQRSPNQTARQSLRQRVPIVECELH